LGADLSPSLCPCNVRHTEFKDYEAAGGIDGIVDIIQFWRGALGERDLELYVFFSHWHEVVLINLQSYIGIIVLVVNTTQDDIIGHCAYFTVNWTHI